MNNFVSFSAESEGLILEYIRELRIHYVLLLNDGGEASVGAGDIKLCLMDASLLCILEIRNGAV
jgi:hypothetical protein